MIAPSYACFEFSKKKGWNEPALRLYPLVCMHLGAPQCDVKFIREHVERIAKDPIGRWVYMGDGGECVTKYSKGDVYGQLLSPQLQIKALQDLLKPIRKKGLFGIRGNHGHRVYKETGLSFDHTLCGWLGIPYLGAAAMVNMVVQRTPYDMYFHHGTDSGISLRAKITAAENFGKHISADAIFTAHSHVALDLTPAPLQFADNLNRRVGMKLRHQYICGTAYDSRTGYAEDKGYPPLIPAYLAVTFGGTIIKGHPKRSQESKRWASDGQYGLTHDYLQQYLEEPGVE